jgi:hypothetical protein
MRQEQSETVNAERAASQIQQTEISTEETGLRAARGQLAIPERQPKQRAYAYAKEHREAAQLP